MKLASYLSPKTKIRKSAIHGFGLFALKPIKKGEVVAIKGGHILDRQSMKKFSNVAHHSELQIDKDFFLAATTKKEEKDTMCYLNHACEPNVGIKGSIIFVAMRNIRADEELTLDYAMCDSAGRYHTRCLCGSSRCRGIVTESDWKRPELQEKFKGFFSAYLCDEIKKVRGNHK